VQQREGEAVAAHADRVAEGDRAAVDVDDLVGDAEVGIEATPTAANASLISNRSTSVTACRPLERRLIARLGW
jgi:hypothetical protein